MQLPTERPKGSHSDQKTTRNWGASGSPVGRISHRQGSISLETGQYPASVIPSSDLAANPNSKTDVSVGLGTSITAPLYESVDCWTGGVVEEVECEGGSLGFSSATFLLLLQNSRPILFFRGQESMDAGPK